MARCSQRHCLLNLLRRQVGDYDLDCNEWGRQQNMSDVPHPVCDYASGRRTWDCICAAKLPRHHDGRCKLISSCYVQVGDPGVDHAVWGRAEDMTMARPPFDVDQNSPGSDLLGQTAAALAAISIIFEKTDPEYALKLEAHARDLYA